MLLPGLLLTCLIALAAAAAAAVAILVWRRRRRRSLAKPSELFTASRAEPQVADSAKLKTTEAAPPDTGVKPPFRKLGEPAPSSPVATPPLPETTTSPALVACSPQSDPSADQPPLGTPDRPHPPVEADPSPRETPPHEPPPVPATSVEEPSSRGEDLPEKEAPTGSEPIEGRIECGDVPAFDRGEHLPLSNELPRAMPVEALPAPEVFPDGHAAPAAPSDQLAPTPLEPPEKVVRPAEPSPAPPGQQARHRDRRGSRRTVPARAQEAKQPGGTSVSDLRQAEAKLRLAIDSNRKSIRLSIVLARPEGFPDRIEPKPAGAEPVYAFDGDRYDDVDIDWTPGFLNAELRLADVEQQLEWLRSARPFHLFGAVPGEPDLLAVPAAVTGVEHSIICRESNIAEVSAAATAAGSPPPNTLQGWMGIPAGWAVLTGYAPTHSFQSQAEPRLQPLDPGTQIDIRLVGGLPVRSNTYAEGHAPRIVIEPLPHGCEVHIGGRHATRRSDGSWTVPGSEAPGRHLVDVVPGPSLTYSVLPDPGAGQGWKLWDAHPERASSAGGATWARPAICGARVFADPGSMVVACESKWSGLALGARAGTQPLARRDDAPAAVAILQFKPAFLILSAGLRRHQGKIAWMGRDPSGVRPRMRRVPDLKWVSAVRAAAARRLAVCPDTSEARSAWRSAAAAARRIRRDRA